MVKIKKIASSDKSTKASDENIGSKNEYKKEAESDGDSSSSEEGPEWTANDEKAFLKTLGALKSKTESIYDNSKNFWNEEGTSSTTATAAKLSKKGKEKKMFLKDYERKLVLEKDGQIDESDDDDEALVQQPGYYEEQDAIKKQFKAAVDGIEDDDGDTLFKKREKTADDENKEESDYYDWIKNNNKHVKVEKEIKSLKEVWENPQLEEDDKFLRDYLLNKDYETDEKFDVPTYDEIVDVEEEQEQMEREREYERKYNFRYEEPDQEFIKQYPRSVSESLRKDDKKTKRKEKRLTKKEEKLLKKKEKIKDMKKKQGAAKSMIEEKLRRLKEASGEDIPLSLEDLKGDFDPAEYDRRMQELFHDKYYGDDVNYEADEKKPVFSDMEDFDEDGFEQEPFVETEKLKKPRNAIAKKEDEGSAISPRLTKNSSEEDEDEDENEAEGKSHRRKDSKRKLKRRKLLEESRKKKPLFDPSEKTFEEYFNEYYAMDFEDLIDDQPTRFRYRSVIPNDFGLTPDEILKADEKNLNSWASVKKAISYRSDEQELYDVQAYKKKSRNMVMKNKIIGSLKDRVELTEDTTDENVEVKTKKKNKGEKSVQGNIKKSQADADHEIEVGSMDENAQAIEQIENHEASSKKAPRRRKKKSSQSDVKETVIPASQEEHHPAKKPTQKRKKISGGEPDKESKKVKLSVSEKKTIPVVSDERLRAYGINPKKYNAKIKYGKKRAEEVSVVP